MHPDYQLIREAEIPEIHGHAYLYRHLPTGADLLHLPSEDSNKSFAVCFNTLPETSSGIAHILEHSVLSGSQKFPLKEPFVNLMKGSLNSFLNAMTFPDKTMYPFASPNEKDFFNLLEVYLDAVFHPLALQEAQIFRQEGWHLDLDESGTPYFNGVVYNEMKGAMSNPASILGQEAHALLFDNGYGLNSGGEPSEILRLSHEDFCAFHKRYYHPSNACFFLSGDLDLERFQNALAPYLAEFSAREAIPPRPASVPKEPQQRELFYPSGENTVYASIDYILGSSDDHFLAASAQVLTTALFDLDSSPLRQRLLSEGLCQDIQSSLDSSCPDLTLSLVFTAAKASRAETFAQTIRDRLAETLKQDLQSLFAAALNSITFALREGDHGGLPRGLLYGVQLLLGWPHSQDPFQRLRYEDDLAAIRVKLEANELPALARKLFLDHSRYAALLLQPDLSLAKKRAQEESREAKARWEALSQTAQQELQTLNNALRQRQETPDSPETLALLPGLELSDIPRENSFKDLQCSEQPGYRLLHYEAFTASVNHVCLFFPLPGGLSELELSELGLLCELLGSVDTANLSFAELTNRVLSETGGLQARILLSPKQAYFALRFKALNGQMPAAFALLSEIVRASRFDNLERLQQILLTLLSRYQLDLISAGSSYATDRAASYLDAEAAAASALSGFTFHEQLKLWNQAFNEEGPRLSARFTELLPSLLQSEGLLVSLLGDEKGKSELLSTLPDFLRQLPQDQAHGREPSSEGTLPANFKTCLRNEALIVPSQVQYVALAAKLPDLNRQVPYAGALYVLQSILNKDYLWTQIRVRGGAYGAGSSLSRNGSFVLYSYRDPNCQSTLDAYRHIPAYLRRLRLEPEELKNYIIGTIADFDHPVSASLAAMQAISRYFSGISLADLSRERQEILDCQLSDLQKFADALHQALETPGLCAIGGEAILQRDAESFKQIRHLG